MKRNDCNIPGQYVSSFIHGCFRPDVDILVYRDDYPPNDEIYSGKARNCPNLNGYRVINIFYDDYYDIFNVEVK
jgi:hypothetical protein